MRQISEAENFAAALSWAFHAKRVTYRCYGKNGELRRPMIHRFEVKGGCTVGAIVANNVTRSNPLFKRLQARA